MAETKQPLVLALGRGYNGFYCPETRFHLVGVVKPQAVYPFEVLSEDVKRGLRAGSLLDVNSVLTAEDVKPSKGFIYNTSAADRKKAILIQAEEKVKEEEAKPIDIQEKEYVDNSIHPNFKSETGFQLSEPDILAATKGDLQKYIDKQEDLNYQALGLNSKSTREDIQEALIKHYGYNEKPENFQETDE